MAIEIPKNITVAASKSCEPKKTVELKSPGGTVVGAATRSPRAIPAVRHTAAENRVNQKMKETLKIASEIFFGILTGPTGCAAQPVQPKPAEIPVWTPPLAEKMETINLDEIKVTAPAVDKPGHSAYIAYEIKKDPSSAQKTIIFMILKKREDDLYPRLSFTHFTDSFDKAANKDVYSNEDNQVRTGSKGMFDKTIDGQRMLRIKTPANEVIDIYVGSDSVMYATLKRPNSSKYYITSFGRSDVDTSTTDLQFDINPKSPLIKESADGKKRFFICTKNDKPYTGRMDNTKAKKNILDKVPEIKDNLSSIFRNPDDEYIVFKPNAKDEIEKLDLSRGKKDILLNELKDTQKNNRPKEFLYNYPSDNIN